MGQIFSVECNQKAEISALTCSNTWEERNHWQRKREAREDEQARWYKWKGNSLGLAYWDWSLVILNTLAVKACQLKITQVCNHRPRSSWQIFPPALVLSPCRYQGAAASPHLNCSLCATAAQENTTHPRSCPTLIMCWHKQVLSIWAIFPCKGLEARDLWKKKAEACENCPSSASLCNGCLQWWVTEVSPPLVTPGRQEIDGCVWVCYFCPIPPTPQ